MPVCDIGHGMYIPDGGSEPRLSTRIQEGPAYGDLHWKRRGLSEEGFHSDIQSCCTNI